MRKGIVLRVQIRVYILLFHLEWLFPRLPGEYSNLVLLAHPSLRLPLDSDFSIRVLPSCNVNAEEALPEWLSSKL